MTTLLPLTTELTEAQFETISRLVRDICGINLHDGKKELVKARLSKRLRTLGYRSFEDYLEHLRQDASGAELTAMLDALSTNLTSFFREPDHFHYLAQKILPRIIAQSGLRQLRIWSAGCSSGEEPYSIAIVLREGVPNVDLWDARVLATDLSTRVLAKATAGVYGEDRVKTVAPPIRARYFAPAQARGERLYRVSDELRRLVHFARLNLMESWPMRGPFDAIFCRNVMIYFDKATQNRLVQRYWELLRPGGVLFIGHSESLTGVNHRFQYAQPTVYQRT